VVIYSARSAGCRTALRADEPVPGSAPKGSAGDDVDTGGVVSGSSPPAAGAPE
jgi:hypothetical protein